MHLTFTTNHHIFFSRALHFITFLEHWGKWPDELQTRIKKYLNDVYGQLESFRAVGQELLLLSAIKDFSGQRIFVHFVRACCPVAFSSLFCWDGHRKIFFFFF
jgi:hypothetical protein